MTLLDKIRANARSYHKRIILPESFEERTMQAADSALKEDLAQIILLGKKDKLLSKASELDLDFLDKATFVDPEQHDKKELYIDLMVEIRKHKGLTHDEASKLIDNPL